MDSGDGLLQRRPYQLVVQCQMVSLKITHIQLRLKLGRSLTSNKHLPKKKKELGTSCMKDFNFHTAHLKHTISKTLTDTLGEAGKKAAELAYQDFAHTFGSEYLDVLEGLYPNTGKEA